MKTKKQLDEWDVKVIIEEEREKRREKRWENFRLATILVLGTILFGGIIWFLIDDLVSEVEQNKYESLCGLKLEGMMSGQNYALDECFAYEEQDYYDCRCYYFFYETNYIGYFAHYDLKEFQVQRGWY